MNADNSGDSDGNSAGNSSVKFRFPNRTLGSAARKIQWEFTMKSEVPKLQNYLSLHVNSINSLLAVYGLELMDLGSAANRLDHYHFEELISNAQRTLDRVDGNLNAQTAIVKSTSSAVGTLLEVVTTVPWKLIPDTVSKIG
jgi:hypothetical protein